MAVLIFVLRLAIGLLLVVAGAFKAHDGLALTGASIAAYKILPIYLDAPLGAFLPYFEIGVGIYLILGLFTRVIALIVTAQMLIFTVAIASAVARRLQISCGCFGSAETTVASWFDVARDAGLAALCALIAWKAPGAFALDRRLAKAASDEEGSTPHE